MTLPIMFEVEVGSPTIEVAVESPQVTTSLNSAPAVLFEATPGPPGPAGPPGTSTPIVGEIPAGAINGVNSTFTTAHAFVTDSTGVYLNGLREFVGDGYTETSSTTIQFGTAPLTGDRVRIDYLVQ